MANPHGVGSAIPPLIPGLHKRAALLSPRFPMLGSPAMGRGGLLPSPNRFVSPHDSFDRGGGGGGAGALPVHYRAVGIRPPLIRAPPLMGVVPQPPQRLPSLLPGRMVPGAPISIHPLLPRLGFGRPGAMPPPPVKRKMTTPPAAALEMGAQAKRARPRHTPSPAPLLKTVARRGHVFAGGKMTLLVPPSSGGVPGPRGDEGRRGSEVPEKNWLTLHCALCSFRTLHHAEMEEHYGGELHSSSLGLLREAHASDSRVVDFLHECTVHKNRRNVQTAPTDEHP
ncbi:splicing factor, proline- and glutamine-rich-like isoform X1 [Lethenteron reissneri]|uniref:splicing factor, proline- and glutamine-rich-like isoform X1 n=2 Tax=Lethenteron reissneri TaxID=7753 RepID=UPI002AB73F8E|nr:splicing factor, proline- and glutamine-rich-like isoform X1 [Lethenteron reissneri]